MAVDTVDLTAPDISCEHCKATIEREVAVLPGVHAVTVDIPTQRVHVEYDASQLSRADVVAKLDDEGYPVTNP